MTRLPEITLKYKSTPFGDEPEGAEAYYTALGRALLLWGRFESQFSYLLDVLCTAPAVRHLRPEEMPISMKRRAELFRKLVKNVPALDAFKAPILAVLPDAMDAAQDRHVLIHGHWNGFVRADPMTGSFIMRKHKGDKLISARYTVSVETLNKMAGIFDSLNLRILPLTISAIGLHPLIDMRKSQAPKE